MILKKLLCVVLMFAIVFSPFGFSKGVSASTDSKTFETNEGPVVFTAIKKDLTNGKVKVEYLDTGKIEYIESVLEDDGSYVQYVKSEDNKVLHRVESVNGDVHLDGKSMNLNAPDKLNNLTSTNKMKADTPQYSDPGGGGGKWTYLSTTYGDTSWYATNASIIASAIAAALGVPAWIAWVGGVATTLAAQDMDVVYIKKTNYVASNATYSTCKRANSSIFYKYSNYTGYVDSSPLTAESIDPCNSGY